MAAETNAERLEEIKDAVDHASRFIGDRGELYFSSGEKLLNDFLWTIQQAELSLVLKASHNRSVNVRLSRQKHIDKLEIENVRLREALGQLRKDIDRHGRYGGYIPKDTSYAIWEQINQALKGESAE